MFFGLVCYDVFKKVNNILYVNFRAYDVTGSSIEASYWEYLPECCVNEHFCMQWWCGTVKKKFFFPSNITQFTNVLVMLIPTYYCIFLDCTLCHFMALKPGIWIPIRKDLIYVIIYIYIPVVYHKATKRICCRTHMTELVNVLSMFVCKFSSKSLLEIFFLSSKTFLLKKPISWEAIGITWEINLFIEAAYRDFSTETFK